MTKKADFNSCTIPKWVNWIAQDANGKWWGYEIEPLRHDSGWYENELGRYILVKSALPSASWQHNLIKINEYL